MNDIKKEIVKISDRIYVYSQIPGAWGYNNAGLIVDKGKGALVDTLFDENLTKIMVEAFKNEIPTDFHIDYVINPHAHGDHWFGNSVFEGAQIISTDTAKLDMKKMSPAIMSLKIDLSFIFKNTGKYMRSVFKPFKLRGIKAVFPNKTFSHQLKLKLNHLTIELYEILNAHSNSDTIVVIPEEKVCFASDLLFVGCTPIAWGTNLANWINALDFILNLDVDYIVPGHGPITDKNGIIQMKKYIQNVIRQTKQIGSNHKSIIDIAEEINLSSNENLLEKERLVTLVHAAVN